MHLSMKVPYRSIFPELFIKILIPVPIKVVLLSLVLFDVDQNVPQEAHFPLIPAFFALSALLSRRRLYHFCHLLQILRLLSVLWLVAGASLSQAFAQKPRC